LEIKGKQVKEQEK